LKKYKDFDILVLFYGGFMYDFKSIEKKWQKYWLENETFKTDIRDFQNQNITY